MPLLTITDFASDGKDITSNGDANVITAEAVATPTVNLRGLSILRSIRKRKYIVLSGRVHPGESNASWMMRGLVNFLVSDSDAARRLRQLAIIKVRMILRK